MKNGKYNYSKRYNRGRRNNRRKYRGRSTQINKQPISMSQIVTMRYCATFQLNPGIGTAAGYSFRANDIYDPDFSGTGHQPYSNDEWANFYNRFQVIGSKINVQFMPTGDTGATGNVICGITKANAATTPSNIDLARERAGTRFKAVSNADALGKCIIQNYYSAKKFWGMNNVTQDDLQKGVMSVSSPSNVAYYNVWASNSNGSDDASFVDCVVTIFYTVLLTDRKTLAQS